MPVEELSIIRHEIEFPGQQVRVAGNAILNKKVAQKGIKGYLIFSGQDVTGFGDV
jgi:hypothetical protein